MDIGGHRLVAGVDEAHPQQHWSGIKCINGLYGLNGRSEFSTVFGMHRNGSPDEVFGTTSQNRANDLLHARERPTRVEYSQAERRSGNGRMLEREERGRWSGDPTGALYRMQDRQLELVLVGDSLDEVILGPFLDATNRRVDVVVGAHDHNGDIRVDRQDSMQALEADCVREHQIQ